MSARDDGGAAMLAAESARLLAHASAHTEPDYVDRVSRGTYISDETGVWYLNRDGEWTRGTIDERNWWPDMHSALSFLHARRETAKLPLPAEIDRLRAALARAEQERAEAVRRYEAAEKWAAELQERRDHLAAALDRAVDELRAERARGEAMRAVLSRWLAGDRTGAPCIGCKREDCAECLARRALAAGEAAATCPPAGAARHVRCEGEGER